MAHLASFAIVRDLIEDRCGLRFDESQRASLSASVHARMRQLGLEHESAYVQRLKGEAARQVEAELRQLLNLVTVTETCFFRDAPQFRMLRERILPALVAARGHIRLWSAGCSSGEEPYSIALTLADMGLLDEGAPCTFSIVGTNLNTSVLQRARRGVYSARAVRNVEKHLLDRYFASDGTNFTLAEGIRRHVSFEFGNIVQTPMPTAGPQDIIFCKNVTIYFSPEVTKRLVRGLHDTLTPGGYLLLGHAESLWPVSEGFALVEHQRAFCYRKIDVQAEAAGLEGSAGPRQRDVALPAEPPPVHEYERCLEACRAGDMLMAESALQELVLRCPTFVPGRLLLGGLYASRGRFDDARAQAEQVLDLSDLEPRAHLLLGMIAARLRRYDEAQQSLRRALYLDDTLGLAHFWLGNLYRERRDYPRASREYANVVRDWERHTLDVTEEFSFDLTPEQLVAFCSDSLHHLQEMANG